MHQTENEMITHLFTLVSSSHFFQNLPQNPKVAIHKSTSIDITRNPATTRFLNTLGILNFEISDKNAEVIGGIPFLENTFRREGKIAFLVAEKINKNSSIFSFKELDTRLLLFTLISDTDYWIEKYSVSLYRDKQVLIKIAMEYIDNYI